jgi:hypothetical protein
MALLAIDCKTLAAQQNMQARMAEAAMAIRQIMQAPPNLRVGGTH